MPIRDILVTEFTYRSVADDFEFELPAEKLRTRGKAQPVSVYELRGARASTAIRSAPPKAVCRSSGTAKQPALNAVEWVATVTITGRRR